MDDRALLRYSRHILLDEFGTEGQARVSAAKVLVVGAGGLGSAALLYLASAGIGHITVADGDEVDLTNLQRQIIHREASLGHNKAESACTAMRAINADIELSAITTRLEAERMESAVAGVDLVLDCCDNFATRHALNRAAVKYRKPLVSGAAIRFAAQITTFDLRQADAPCYHCLFPEQRDGEEERCALMGVFAPLVGIVGATQAAEALKVIAEVGSPLCGQLLMLDAKTMVWQSVHFRRDPQCAVCAQTSGPTGGNNVA